MPRGRGSNRNANPDLPGYTGNRWSDFAVDSNAEPLLWSNVDAGCIGATVAAVTRCGDAILFGVVSGGGALAITIMSGDQRIRRYARTVDEAEALLAEIENYASDRAG